MAERLIFHADCNNFFASCECLERPELKNVPMAVAGDPRRRSGIVLAKNDLAKKAGVKTTDTLWQARAKCPELVFVPPRMHFYGEISRRVNRIYLEYTDYVEPASIDESYLDLSGTLRYYRMTARELADSLRMRVKRDIGITISVGVSFNKTFAKMGSDYKKPDATTEITRENFRQLLWPLPVEDLLFVGKSASSELHKYNITTIGDLARWKREDMGCVLGKSGESLWDSANGLDESPVRLFIDRPQSKSVSRGNTFAHDLVTMEEIRSGLSHLADEVAGQLRREGLKGTVVQVQIKNTQLQVFSRQTTLAFPTFTRQEILQAVLRLVEENWRIGPSAPIRALTVGVTHLIRADRATQQVSLLDELDGARTAREKQERLELAIDRIRQKMGKDAIALGRLASEKEEDE